MTSRLTVSIQVLSLTCAIAAGCASVATAAAHPTIQDVVDSFYPESRLEPDAPQDRQSCYGIVETTRGVPATIVAGYTADTYAAIRVLRADGAGGYTVAWESPETWLMLGNDCFVEVKNVDGNPALEAFVTFERRRATTGWLLTWNGTAVENLTPMDRSANVNGHCSTIPHSWISSTTKPCKSAPWET